MSIWEARKSENYEAEQKAREAVFNKIVPRGNWKAPIRKWIEKAELAECNQAAIWFTGGGLTVVAGKGTKVLVVGGGYYANVGA